MLLIIGTFVFAYHCFEAYSGKNFAPMLYVYIREEGKAYPLGPNESLRVGKFTIMTARPDGKNYNAYIEKTLDEF